MLNFFKSLKIIFVNSAGGLWPVRAYIEALKTAALPPIDPSIRLLGFLYMGGGGGGAVG